MLLYLLSAKRYARENLYKITPFEKNSKTEVAYMKGGEDCVVLRDLASPELDRLVGADTTARLHDDVTLLQGAANPFDFDEYRRAGQTPVFFGSAINNFGVRELLDAFVELAPPPGPRATLTRTVAPEEEAFTGFTFKIQANMVPGHIHLFRQYA